MTRDRIKNGAASPDALMPNAKQKKVLIAMSGGVDSSVAAFLIKEAGYDCSAVMLSLFDTDEDAAPGSIENCVRSAAYNDAAEVCRRLEISFEALDYRSFFREDVVERFVATYLDGATPNPCVECNKRIKFGRLIDYAAGHGFGCVATGHYANVVYDAQTGRYQLYKAADSAKDQSYMLYTLSQWQLSRVMFPLGNMIKNEVRAIAEAHGLPNAGKSDSQDICFIPDDDYPAFIERYTGTAAPCGDILDCAGNVVGGHRGAIRYTIGQRKGLGLYAPHPLYVNAKSMIDNTVTVGPESSLYSDSFIVRRVNLIPVRRLSGAVRASVKTRYSHRAQPATVEQTGDDEIRVKFDTPQRAITPGQSAVFYDGDAVLGGGIIQNNPSRPGVDSTGFDDRFG